MEWIDDEIRMRRLLCSIIQQAVEDYRACRAMDFVENDQFNRIYFNDHRRANQWRSTKNITAESDVRSLITFFYRGGLERVIEMGKLKDPTTMKPLCPDAIRYRLKFI